MPAQAQINSLYGTLLTSVSRYNRTALFADTPLKSVGVCSIGYRTIIHILKVPYLKIAFFLSLIYDSYAGEVFLHFVQ